MSNRRKLPKRRSHTPAPTPGPGEGYICQFGVVSDRHVEDDIEEALTGTHDTLIRLLGDRRRSGIWWTQYFARDGVEWLRELIPDDDPDQRAIKIRDEAILRLSTPTSLLVVAWAIATEAGATPGGEQS